MAGLSPSYPPTWRGRPPSMPWSDWQVWQRFLVSSYALYDAYAYDVELVAPQSLPANLTPQMQQMWLRNNAKRIDAIGERGGIRTLIEVRALATFQTIGQILGYQTLFPDAFPGVTISAPMIVCSSAADQIPKIAAAQGITLAIVGTGPGQAPIAA